jgi:hypothetical protein
MKNIFLLITILLTASGCSSKQSSADIETDMKLADAPAWVNEGTNTVSNEDGRLIHGVGSAPAMGDLSLQKATADNRARAEIARIMSTFIDSTLADYSASNGESFDMSVDKTLKSSTRAALSGAIIIGSWRSTKSGEVYSFAELDLKKLETSIANADKVNQSFKDYSKQNLEANFDRFTQGNNQ